MKFSELSTDKSLDVMCELTPYIDSIVNDPDVVSTIGKVVATDGDKLNKYGVFLLGAGRITELAPLLLKTHRADVYGILSVLYERSAEEIANQPVKETLAQMKEVLEDAGLMDFFRSFARQGKTEQSAPSADSPASE